MPIAATIRHKPSYIHGHESDIEETHKYVRAPFMTKYDAFRLQIPARQLSFTRSSRRMDRLRRAPRSPQTYIGYL